MEEYNEREMARMRKSIIFCVALMMVMSMPTALAAITVDGYKSTGEWSENWSFAQDHATTYNTNGPFGDRLVIRQGGYAYPLTVTDTWYDTDPKDDSAATFDVSMATLGDSSGFDIANIYAHYDPITDTVYGLTEVYGIPGDLDGDGDIAGQVPADQGGSGPAGSGLGPTEYWNLRMIQGSTFTDVNLIDNDWSITGNGLVYGDINAKFTSGETNSVYEISLSGISDHYSVAPGAIIGMQLLAGSSGDQLGEDTAVVFITVPNPDIRIVKTTSNGQGGWADGPLLTVDDTVTWRYVVTNMGDVPLTDIVVTDNKEGEITSFSKDYLNPQESMTAYKSGTVLNTQYFNRASVIGYYQGIPFSSEDPSNYRTVPPTDVPALTPAGLLGLIGVLGIIGIVGMKRRN